MHYSVRYGHRGLRPMPIVARLCFMFTLYRSSRYSALVDHWKLGSDANNTKFL